MKISGMIQKIPFFDKGIREDKVEKRHTNWDENTIVTILICFFALAPILGKLGSGLIPIFTVLGVVFLYTGLLREKRTFLKRAEKPLEFCIVVMGTLSLLGILLFCLGLDIGQQEGYETEFLILFFSLFYYYVYSKKQIKSVNFAIVLHIYSGILVVALMEFLVFPQMGIFTDSWQNASMALLVALMAVIHYCYSKIRGLRLIYITEAVVAFLVLAINHNVISLYIMCLMLFLLAALLPPRVKPIKRSLQMFFCFTFLISNMSLFTNYTGLFPVKEPGYSLETSVLVDLLLCVLGVYVTGVWDKLPLEKEYNCTLPLRRMQKNLLRVSVGFVGIFLFFGLCGNHLGKLPGGTIFNMAKVEIDVLFKVCQASLTEGLLFRAAEEYGLFGIVVCLVNTILVIERIVVNRRFLHHENIILTMCSCLFGIIFCFYSINAKVLPVYSFMLICALIPDMQYVKGNKKLWKN